MIRKDRRQISLVTGGLFPMSKTIKCKRAMHRMSDTEIILRDQDIRIVGQPDGAFPSRQGSCPGSKYQPLSSHSMPSAVPTYPLRYHAPSEIVSASPESFVISFSSALCCNARNKLFLGAACACENHLHRRTETEGRLFCTISSIVLASIWIRFFA